MEPFIKNPSLLFKYLPLLQFVAGVIQVLDSRDNNSWEELQGIEKILLLSATEGESLNEQIIQLLTEKGSFFFYVQKKKFFFFSMNIHFIFF